MAKMTDIALDEVSGVDHPAHLIEGFAVIKAAGDSDNRALFSALRKETMPEKTLAEVLKDATAEQIREALTAEQLSELAPVAKAEDENAEDAIMKSLPEPVRELIEKAQATVAAAEERERVAVQKAAEAEETRQNEAAIQKSKDDFTNLGFDHAVVAPALRAFAKEHGDAAEAITKMLTAVNEQADGAILKELGTAAGGDNVTEATPAEKLESLAKAKAEADKVPFAKAFADVVADEANAELVAAHFEETH